MDQYLELALKVKADVERLRKEVAAFITENKKQVLKLEADLVKLYQDMDAIQRLIK